MLGTWLDSTCPYASMVTLASVADSRLFDLRVGDDKAYITTMACNRHLSIVELSPATREAGQNRTWYSTSPSSGSTT